MSWQNLTIPIPDPTGGDIDFSSVGTLIEALYCVGNYIDVIGIYQTGRFSTPTYLSSINAVEINYHFTYAGRGDESIRFMVIFNRDLSSSEKNIFNTVKTVQVYSYISNAYQLACLFSVNYIDLSFADRVVFRGSWNTLNETNMISGTKMRLSFKK